MKISAPWIILLLFGLLSCSNDSGDIPSKGKGQVYSDDPTFHYQTLTAGPLRLDIDPKAGARIASFSYEGKEILKTSRDEAGLQWGSTVWTSPQSDWNWPPPSFDHVEYDFSKTAENRMHFYSPVDKVTNLQVIKSFRVAIDEARGPLTTIRYQVYNRGSEAVKVAVWENTRVPYAGETRFSVNGEYRFKNDDREVVYREDDGTVLLEFNTSQPDTQKIYYTPTAPAKGRYLFNTYENDGLLLIKSWKKPFKVAPGHAPLEIYLAPKKEFAELEVQGNYKEIQPGQFVDLTVFWQLFPAEDRGRRLNPFR